MTKFSSERFFGECGGAEPIEILLEDQKTESYSVFYFQHPSILVGNHAGADIQLRHPAIREQQLYLQLLDGRLFGIDLSGHMTTQWGGQKKGSGWITQHDIIQLGPYRLKILKGIRSFVSEQAEQENPLISSNTAIPPLALEHRTHPPRIFRGIVNRNLSLLGNSPLCKFRIRNEEVSPVHCSLVRTSHGIWIVDLGSTSGIQVNGLSTTISFLENDDVLAIGGIEFHIRYETGSHRVSPSLASPAANLALVRAKELALATRSEPKASETAGEEPAFHKMIGPIIQHFTELQKQNFLQFQQLLHSVVQMFGNMFQHQQTFIQEEMKRFDQITQEVSRLRDVLKALPAPPPFADEIAANPTAASELNQEQWKKLDQLLNMLSEPPPFADPVSTEATKAAKAKSSPAPEQTSPMADGQMHLWIESRIADLQQQQGSLWSRLSGLLGK